MVENQKVCLKCKVEKPLTAFSPAKNGRLGVKSYCKACRKLMYQENRDQVLAGMKAARQKDPELFQQKRLSRYQKNIELAREVTSKVCKKCGLEKPLTDFHLCLTGKYGKRSRCADCINDQIKQGYHDDVERSRQKAKETHQRHLTGRRKWYYSNHEQRKAACKARYYRDKTPYLLRSASRRKAIQRATPSWANVEAIKAIYAEAVEKTLQTGVLHHVDHIDPLTSDRVCGLHVHNNLQILPAAENFAKHNRFIPYGIDANGNPYTLN